MQNSKCPKAFGVIMVKVESKGERQVYCLCFADSAKHKLLMVGKKRKQDGLGFLEW